MSSQRTDIIGNTDPAAAILNAASVDDNQGDKAFRVVISNQPLQLALTSSKISGYNEVSSLAAAATATIINYTVPANKKITLSTVFVHGENRAQYIVEVNGSVRAKFNTYYTKLYDHLRDLGIELIESDNLKIIVNNRGKDAVNFNANFSGDIFDA